MWRSMRSGCEKREQRGAIERRKIVIMQNARADPRRGGRLEKEDSH